MLVYFLLAHSECDQMKTESLPRQCKGHLYEYQVHLFFDLSSSQQPRLSAVPIEVLKAF